MMEERKKIIDRLRRIEGQIRGVQRLIEQEAHCVDVLTQVAAVTSAMKKTGAAIVAAHMKKCFDESTGKPLEKPEELYAVLTRFINLS